MKLDPDGSGWIEAIEWLRSKHGLVKALDGHIQHVDPLPHNCILNHTNSRLGHFFVSFSKFMLAVPACAFTISYFVLVSF